MPISGKKQTENDSKAEQAAMAAVTENAVTESAGAPDADARNSLKRDALTGLLNRESFFTEAQRLIKSHAPGTYILSCFDIENFKVINDQYGTEKGDELLSYIASTVNGVIAPLGGLCCRFTADRFAILYPAAMKDSAETVEIHKKTMAPDCISRKIRIRIGRYTVDDLSLSVSAMYDRATMAQESIKNRFDVFIAYYHPSMREKVLREQQIVNEMVNALHEGQFEPFFQPQVNHANGSMIGAEALVRWKKDGGFVSPAEFIPVFERNGFIYEMDQYIWGEVCRFLRRRLDEGKPVLPISVNISRRDLQHQHFIPVLTDIIGNYKIPYDLIRLEVTESAFVDSAVMARVNRLIDLGFTVEIDDFGSGYSSLNTLKDVPASILKLDMKFFENTKNNQRSGNIVESVVRMAKWLGMAVIAEGVEDGIQADYLKSIGCYYIQGYYYARPMPMAEFERQLDSNSLEPKLTRLQTLDTLDTSEFWDPKSMETLIFNSYVGGACIFEYHNGKTELLRVNERYVKELGKLAPVYDKLIDTEEARFVDNENAAKLLENIRTAIRTDRESTCEFRLSDGTCEEYIRSTVRVIARTGERYLFYCVIVNMTEQRLAQEKRNESVKRLLDNLPCGAALFEYNAAAARLTVGHINKRYWELVEREPADYSETSVLDVIHREDRDSVIQEIEAAIRQKRNIGIDIRIRCGSGMYKLFRVAATVRAASSGNYTLYTSYMPVTGNTMSAQELIPVALATMMSASEDLSFVKDRAGRYLCCSGAHAKALGLSNERDIIGRTDEELFGGALAQEFSTEDRKIMESGRAMLDRRQSLPTADGGTILVSTSKYPIPDTMGNIIGICGISRDVTAQTNNDFEINTLLNVIPSGILKYAADGTDTFAYVNRNFIEGLGYTQESFREKFDNRFSEMVWRDDRESVKREIAGQEAEGRIGCFDFRVEAADGSLHWFHDEGVKVRDRQGAAWFYVTLVDVTKQRKTAEDLRRSEEEYRVAIRHSGHIIGRYDIAAGTLTIAEDGMNRPDTESCIRDVPYGGVKSGLISADTAAAYITFYEKIRRGEKECGVTYQKLVGGAWRWMSERATVIFDADGKPVCAIISCVDVTEQQQKEAAYKKWQQTLALRDPASYTLLCCNLNKNESEDTVEGGLFDLGEKRGELSFDRMMRGIAERYVAPEDRTRFLAFAGAGNLLASYYRGKRADIIEFRRGMANGETRWLRLSAELVEYPNSTDVEAYLMFEDIDDTKTAELATMKQAQTDPLTGLYNRKAFAGRLEQLLTRQKPGTIGALIFMDMDGFKQVNDSFGHSAGDRVLVDTAENIRSALQTNDLVCRLGGDEFLVYFGGMPDRNAIRKKAEDLCRVCRRPFRMGVRLSVSIGIAVCPEDGTAFDPLYQRADKALYYVKEHGKNGCAFYHGDMNRSDSGKRPLFGKTSVRQGGIGYIRSLFADGETAIAEYDRYGGKFLYDSAFGKLIAGKFDHRTLWRIFDEDGVASAADTERLVDSVGKLQSGVAEKSCSVTVALRTPSGETHPFRVRILRCNDGPRRGERFLLIFTDLKLIQ